MTCTAEEIPVPENYTASGCTVGVQLNSGGSAQCTLTNTLILASGTFTVNKVYDPANTIAPVSVTLNCPGATVENNPQSAAPGNPAVFNVSGIPPSGVGCTATENPVPAGYTVSGCSVAVQLGPNGSAQCILTNTEAPPADGTYTVHKIYNPANNTTPVSVRLTCAAGTVTNSPQMAAPGSPAVFNVTNLPQTGAGCIAFENPVPDGYTASGCTVQKILTPGGNLQCTLTNTQVPTTGTFTVHKQYTGQPTGGLADPPASVSITLSCPGATVTNSPQMAFTGDPAVFNVTGIPQGGVDCTASEDAVPAGWTPQGCTNAVHLNPGASAGCTITNVFTSPGRLNFRVYLRPNNDPGRFDLRIDGRTLATRADHRGQTDFQQVSGGAHQVLAVPSPGTSASNYSFSIDCISGYQIVASADSRGPLTVNVPSGASVDCVLYAQRVPSLPPPTSVTLYRAGCSSLHFVQGDQTRIVGSVTFQELANGDLRVTVNTTGARPNTYYRWVLVDTTNPLDCRVITQGRARDLRTTSTGLGQVQFVIPGSKLQNSRRVAVQLTYPSNYGVPNPCLRDVLMSNSYLLQ